MNLQTLNRRKDLPVQLGDHGYRLDGDEAVLHAELHVPAYFSGPSVGLELWACAAPHQGGAPRGVKIAEVSLDLPTPIGPHVQRVEARTAMTPPPGSGAHAMVLVLVGGSAEARRVHDFANYERLQHFASPQLSGCVAYSIEGDEVVLRAASVSNPRPEGRPSGSLSMELWACAEPHAGGAPRGHRLAGADLGGVWGRYELPNVCRRVAFAPPPPGRWHLTLLLREWTLAGYAPRDYRNFDLPYVQPAATATPARPPRAGEMLRLLEPVAGVDDVPAAVVPASEGVAPAAPARAGAVAGPAATVVSASAASASGKLSIAHATLEELAALPGLSPRIAKEIVKKRPFASIDALLGVRGIGEKTLRRIKGLLTL